MRYAFSQHISMSRTEYGAAVLDSRSGRYFQLNPIAAEMLEMLSHGKSLDEVHKTIGAEYSVEPQRVNDDLKRLISHAKASDILQELET